MIAGLTIGLVLGFVAGWWMCDQYRPGPKVPIPPAAPPHLRYRPVPPVQWSEPDVTPPGIKPSS